LIFRVLKYPREVKSKQEVMQYPAEDVAGSVDGCFTGEFAEQGH